MISSRGYISSKYFIFQAYFQQDQFKPVMATYGQFHPVSTSSSHLRLVPASSRQLRPNPAGNDQFSELKPARVRWWDVAEPGQSQFAASVWWQTKLMVWDCLSASIGRTLYIYYSRRNVLTDRYFQNTKLTYGSRGSRNIFVNFFTEKSL